ncbi:LamG domain-containing protein [candidate division WWE3 bacterium]|uniref:LamG domain-containing protein n=1 Tax=candidate division WWE3 bacterium TaxID=2053526 RepID=A0A7X9HGN0_UNCKA|nr:LamG domain-containing protein [candidate division WWE3 bacterium]
MNLIDSKSILFIRKTSLSANSISEAFKEYKQPLPFSRKVRRTFAVVSVLTLMFTLSYFTFKWLQKVNAAAQNYSWDFSNAGDYTVSDSALVEISGGRAQLKVRNYTSDDNTIALYHFDENTGTDITDSSSNSNTGVLSGGSWSTGQLNSAIHFKYSGTGPTNVVTVQDSASLSLNQSMSLEAWTKFDSTFGEDTHMERQTVLDKGTYQLYYDPQTAKIVYEIQDGTQSWVQQAGSKDASFGSEPEINNIANHTWDTNGKPSVHAMVEMDGYIYVGLGDFTNAAVAAPSDAEIWRYSPTTGIWEFFAGDGVGWANETYDDVFSLATDGSRLFAGLGSTTGEADVYMYSGGTWTQIGGDGDATLTNADSWPATTYEVVMSMAVSGSQLFVGLGLSGGDAEVWKCTDVSACRSGTLANGGTGWTKIGGDSTGTGDDSWTNAYDYVRSMAVSGTNLVVGLGVTAGEAEVWRCANFNTCTTTSGWNKVGGDGTASGDDSWASTQEVVTTMFVDGNALYVGLGSTGNEGEVWYCSDLTTCTPTAGWLVVGNSTDFGTGIEQVWTLTGDATYVYAGLGNSNNGAVSNAVATNDTEVWRCTRSDCDTTWTRLAGDAAMTAPAYNTNIPMYSHTNVRSLLLSSDVLYIGLQAMQATNIAEVWSCTAATCDSTLERIAGNYIRKSWGYYGMQSVESIGRANGKLYVGTGYTTYDSGGLDGYYGNATVWEYDKDDSVTPWEIIGGQGIHNGWGMLDANSSPYEAVLSMMSYSGDLYVGLGISEANRDAEVWKWDDTLVGGTGSWSKVGGDTINTSWDSGSEAHAGVYSLAVHNCSGSSTSLCLFAGLGGGNNDAEVWEYNGSTWTIRGGDSASNWNTAGGHNYIYTLKAYNGNLYAGLGGTGAGEAEVWKWSGTGSVWTKVGGDGVGSTWTVHNTVESLAVYQGELYAGLGYGSGYGDVWKYNGSTWEQVGGDNIYGSWDDINYEIASALKVYNGLLYVGLGRTAGDGEVWVYDGTSGDDRWDMIGGDGTGWTNGLFERVRSMAIYDGKLWAGLGDTANNDARVWTYGADKVLESETIGQDTDWHHLAATYDGDIMRLFIDGVQDASLDVNAVLVPDTAAKLYIGASAGNIVPGGKRGEFYGEIDEVRISNTARSISNIIYKPYS